MDHVKLSLEFEKELTLQKAKEDYLKARQILSDKQNTEQNLRDRYNEECCQLLIIGEAWGKFTATGNLEQFMIDIKDTNYFGKR